MKKTSITLLSLFMTLLQQISAQVQDLKYVTSLGNATNTLIRVEGADNIPNTGAGLELYYSNNQGYLQSRNRTGNVNTILNLAGAAINTTSRTLINFAQDDGNTALQVNGGIKTTGSNYRIFTGNILYGYGTIDLSENGSRRVFMGYNAAPTTNSYATFGVVGDDGTERGIYIQRASGNVGIGTPTPKATLAVNGDLFAKKVRVTLSDWPDYVFQDNYQLPSLQAIEKYINEHKHLPDMPSAKKVIADGLDVGEMNKKLLQKVEELTLHLIQQQKEIEELKAWKNSIKDEQFHK
ncbi:hypothetical protein [Chitinophaga sp. 212800010-3]|uniref:hypothetical protein n=1 Tax=unclassified Chitinophaga TaxID=2619133 RepID=UPI002DED4A74|nr:Peptidase S74 domain-containing protein [Chitinophaga sp. 212800010-3]